MTNNDKKINNMNNCKCIPKCKCGGRTCVCKLYCLCNIVPKKCLICEKYTCECEKIKSQNNKFNSESERTLNTENKDFVPKSLLISKEGETSFSFFSENNDPVSGSLLSPKREGGPTFSFSEKAWIGELTVNNLIAKKHNIGQTSIKMTELLIGDKKCPYGGVKIDLICDNNTQTAYIKNGLDQISLYGEGSILTRSSKTGLPGISNFIKTEQTSIHIGSEKTLIPEETQIFIGTNININKLHFGFINSDNGSEILFRGNQLKNVFNENIIFESREGQISLVTSKLNITGIGKKYSGNVLFYNEQTGFVSFESLTNLINESFEKNKQNLFGSQIQLKNNSITISDKSTTLINIGTNNTTNLISGNTYINHQGSKITQIGNSANKTIFSSKIIEFNNIEEGAGSHILVYDEKTTQIKINKSLTVASGKTGQTILETSGKNLIFRIAPDLGTIIETRLEVEAETDINTDGKNKTMIGCKENETNLSSSKITFDNLPSATQDYMLYIDSKTGLISKGPIYSININNSSDLIKLPLSPADPSINSKTEDGRNIRVGNKSSVEINVDSENKKLFTINGLSEYVQNLNQNGAPPNKVLYFDKTNNSVWFGPSPADTVEHIFESIDKLLEEKDGSIATIKKDGGLGKSGLIYINENGETQIKSKNNKNNLIITNEHMEINSPLKITKLKQNTSQSKHLLIDEKTGLLSFSSDSNFSQNVISVGFDSDKKIQTETTELKFDKILINYGNWVLNNQGQIIVLESGLYEGSYGFNILKTDEEKDFNVMFIINGNRQTETIFSGIISAFSINKNGFLIELKKNDMITITITLGQNNSCTILESGFMNLKRIK